MRNQLIKLEGISVRLRDKLFLENTSWEIKKDENWAILGPNGSGKSILAKALLGSIPIVRGTVTYNFNNHSQKFGSEIKKSISYVSSEMHKNIILRERKKDRSRHFSGAIHDYTSVRDIILEGINSLEPDNNNYGKALIEVARNIGIHLLLDRPIISISHGEMRKTLIARALINKPKLMIMDDPFDGLDGDAKQSLSLILNELIGNGMNGILITHRIEEILPNITHVLFLENGKIQKTGEKNELLPDNETKPINCRKEGYIQNVPKHFKVDILSQNFKKNAAQKNVSLKNEVLLEMKNATVKYGDFLALQNFNWKVEDGQNWALLGPNGSGKSTVLKLLLGDNLQGYSNEIYLFGKRKGTGESVWETKKQIGIVSAEIQAKYNSDINVFDTVCSGFFDSMGLYRNCTSSQKTGALELIRLFGIENLLNKNISLLSYGERQLVLIARSMVKKPKLLFLDEPCDGLDCNNRSRLLNIIELIGSHTQTNIVYITHHENEIVPCIKNILRMKNGEIIGFENRG